jgi:arylsulfatase A-like enzyme
MKPWIHFIDNNPYPQNRLYRGSSLEQMGGPGTFHSYGTGWANVSNTPFRLYKHYNHEGGISAPLIMHWPSGLKRAGRIERSPAHVIDLAATLIDLGEARYPAGHAGHPILPLAGKSLRPILSNQPLQERPLFFEREGNRAVRLGKWKIVWTNYARRWELYDMEVDRSEVNDRAKEFPVRVRAMEKLWNQWAETHFVEPSKVPQPATGMPKIYYWRDG